MWALPRKVVGPACFYTPNIIPESSTRVEIVNGPCMVPKPPPWIYI